MEGLELASEYPKNLINALATTYFVAESSYLTNVYPTTDRILLRCAYIFNKIYWKFNPVDKDKEI